MPQAAERRQAPHGPRARVLLACTAVLAGTACDTCSPDAPTGPPLPLRAGGVTVSMLQTTAGRQARVAGRKGDFLLEMAGMRLVVGGGGVTASARPRHGVLLDLAVDALGEDLLTALEPVVLLGGVGGVLTPLRTDWARPEAGKRASLHVRQLQESGPLVVETWIRPDPAGGTIQLISRATNRSARIVRGVRLGDSVAWPGAPTFAPGLGFVQAQTRAAVPWIARRGEELSYALAFDAPTEVEFRFDRVGPTEQLALGTAADLVPGASTEWRRRLMVVRGGLATVAERAWKSSGTALGVVEGRVPEGADWVVVEAHDEGGRPVLGVRAEASDGASADGTWRMALPVGEYALVLSAPGGEDSELVTVVPGRPPLRVDLLPPHAGALRVRVTNRKGTPVPSRLLIRGVSPTRDPMLGPGETAAGAGNIVYALRGEAELDLPPGRYRVTATHGPEHTIDTAEATLTGDRGVSLRLRVERAFETPGFVACDFHLHAAPSPDSSVTLEDRVSTLVAEGIELAVATDHDHVTDYRPATAALEQDHALASIPGVEITTAHWGHFIAFPLDPALPPPVHEGKAPDELFAMVRELAPDAVLQINHPRMEHIGYFDAIGLDASTGVATEAHASFDFDTLEVVNGFELRDIARMDASVKEWLTLVRLGHKYAAVGNSDSHRLFQQWAGYPRTWVRVADDQPSAITAQEIADALRGQHAIVSTGPFVLASIADAGPGNLARAEDGFVKLAVEVRAAPWVDITRLEALVDGELAAAKRVHRFAGSSVPVQWRTTLATRDDATVVVVVRGDEKLTAVGVPARPFAFTNPIYVDADGDGAWTPAGQAAAVDGGTLDAGGSAKP